MQRSCNLPDWYKMRVSLKQLQNMAEMFNKYHDVSMNGHPHKLIVEQGINGLGLVWLNLTDLTHSQNLTPSTAMSKWETYLCLKVLTDGEIYREQAKLTIRRNY